MPKKGHSFNVVMPEALMTKLKQVATKSECSAGQIVRTAIHAHWSMLFETKPACANGQRCFVPNYHVPQTPPAAAESPPTELDP